MDWFIYILKKTCMVHYTIIDFNEVDIKQLLTFVEVDRECY